jgi:hypothetical protein
LIERFRFFLAFQTYFYSFIRVQHATSGIDDDALTTAHNDKQEEEEEEEDEGERPSEASRN